METSDGLGLRGLGVAASRTGTLASLTATATPVGAAATLVPGVGPFLAASLAALVASYALSWELLDPYFDKKGFGYEQQDKIMWANRFALCAFAAPFTVALAVPLFRAARRRRRARRRGNRAVARPGTGRRKR